MKLNLSELHYNLGYVLHQQGNLVGAAAAYRQAIEQDPTFAQAHHGLAVVLGEQFEDEAAVRQYQQMIQRWPDDVTAYNNLACLLVQQGKLPDAIDLYRQAIEQHPDAAILYSNLGQVIEAEDPVAAIAAYRQALELRSDLTAAAIQLGFALFKQNQYDAALEIFSSVHRREPQHVQAQLGTGLVYQALGQWNQAFAHFRQALKPQQAYIDAFCAWAASISTASISTTDALALARRSCGQFLQALCNDPCSDPPQIVAIGSGQSKAEVFLADTCFHLGNLLVEYGGKAQLQQAERYYQQALQLQPDCVAAYLGLGNCLAQQQRWNAAIFVYHLALAKYPEAVQIYQQLGQLCEQQQRWPDAIAYYRRAFEQVMPGQGHRYSAQSSQSFVSVDVRQPICASVDHGNAKLEMEVASSVPATSALQCCSTKAYFKRTRQGQFVSLPVGSNPSSSDCAIPDSLSESSAAKFASTYTATQPNCNGLNCDGLNCQPCLARLGRQFTPVQIGRGLYRLSSPASTPPFPTFVAHLPQAQAWITPYQSAWKVNNAVAVVTADRHLLTDVSREYPGQLPVCTHSPTVQRFLQRSEQPPEPIAGRVAAVAGLSGHNYFHWMVDVLPRLELLRRSGLNWQEIDWFWINTPRAAFQQDTLRHLGIPTEKILAADHHPYIQADDLIVPAFAGHLGWPDPWVLEFLRRQFLPVAATRSYPERIYISRARAHHRRVLNEAAVIDRLQARGFVPVELESISFAEQVGLFAQAQVVLAPHGGGLTNLIFCQPGTRIVECFAPNYLRPYYWQISQHLNLQHHYMLGTAFSCPPIHQFMYPSPLMEDIWLDLEMLEMALAQLDC